MPKWDGAIWAGDSRHAGITRAQAGQTIRADDPRFDDYIAMTYADFRSLYSTYVLGCKEWYPGTHMMTEDEALERFRTVIEEMQAHGAH